MQVDKSGFCEFSTVVNKQVFQSRDDLDEMFFLYYREGGLDKIGSLSLYRMKRAARFLERLYLREIPFVLVFSDDIVDCFHVGWGVFMPHFDDWLTLLESENHGVLLVNQLADNFVISKGNVENVKDMMYNLDISQVYNWHEECNLQLFFMGL